MHFPRFLSSRYLVLIAAFLMQVCLGATYSWTVFVPEVRAITGLHQSTAQIPYSVFYVLFPATALFAGVLLAKFGTRWCSILGGILFGGGWILAGLGETHFAFTVAGIGVLSGVGVGISYMVPITVCVRWFPDRRGLATGVAVAGFGGSPMLVSPIAQYLMDSVGLSPFAAFRCIGLAAMLLVACAAVFMRFPQGKTRDSVKTVFSDTGPIVLHGPARFSQVVAERVFHILYFAMFAGLAAGFVVNANLKSLSGEGAGSVGVTAVVLFGWANAVGRLAWGWIFDRMHKTPAAPLVLNLALQAMSLLVALCLLRTPPGLLIVALLAGFNYGGVLVLYASTATRYWGVARVGHIYGWLLSSNIPAAAAPYLAGAVYDRWQTFNPSFVAVAILLLIAAGTVFSRSKMLHRER
jgi:MFS transporter, OFA family, oxalate/formate antiporter